MHEFHTPEQSYGTNTFKTSDIVYKTGVNYTHMVKIP